MRTSIPERLLKIGDDIQESGSASLTRLTVLKKWFDKNPKRFRSFAIFIANRASTRKGKITGEAAELFRDARLLLKSVDIVAPNLSKQEAENLHRRLVSFQNEYQKQNWGMVRVIKNRNLFLVEEGLQLFLLGVDNSFDGYHLAAKYCENYDSKYGNSLNGPSITKINEIVRFMFTFEALEEFTVDDLCL